MNISCSCPAQCIELPKSILRALASEASECNAERYKEVLQSYLAATKVNRLQRASAAFRSGLLPPKLYEINACQPRNTGRPNGTFWSIYQV